MPTAVAWRGVFLEWLKATGNVALAAVGAGRDPSKRLSDT